MKYILSPHIALRSWHLVPYAHLVKGCNFARGLKKEEFELMLSCDGQTDLPESDLLKELLKRDLIREAGNGETLTPWQQPLFCQNRYVPQMNFQITAKCNYNCVHCFNAADNAPMMSEMAYADVLKLLDEAKMCGVYAITITGGEPMMHSNFMTSCMPSTSAACSSLILIQTGIFSGRKLSMNSVRWDAILL